VLFQFESPFEGELTIFNDPKSPNSLATVDGSLVVSVDPSTRNTYNGSNWPDHFQTRARFADGSPVQTTIIIQSAKYSISVVGWDSSKNMVIKMTKN